MPRSDRSNHLASRLRLTLLRKRSWCSSRRCHTHAKKSVSSRLSKTRSKTSPKPNATISSATSRKRLAFWMMWLWRLRSDRRLRTPVSKPRSAKSDRCRLSWTRAVSNAFSLLAASRETWESSLTLTRISHSHSEKEWRTPSCRKSTGWLSRTDSAWASFRVISETKTRLRKRVSWW